MAWSDHKQGILGTIIFHLIVIIILLFMKIRQIQDIVELKIEYEQQYTEQEQEKEEEKIKEIVKKSSEEEVEKMLRSLVSNENAKEKKSSRELQDMDEYIEEALKEVNDFKGYDLYKAKRDENFTADSIKNAKEAEKNRLDSLESTVYLAGSSVSYKLGNRYKRYLPIPIFKCENGGTVTVNIEVNQKGEVTEALVDGSRSDSDLQLRETAREAALRSRFNESYNAPPIERGTITYHFVKQ